MIQATKIIGTGLATTGLIGAGTEIRFYTLNDLAIFFLGFCLTTTIIIIISIVYYMYYKSMDVKGDNILDYPSGHPNRRNHQSVILCKEKVSGYGTIYYDVNWVTNNNVLPLIAVLPRDRTFNFYTLRCGRIVYGFCATSTFIVCERRRRLHDVIIVPWPDLAKSDGQNNTVKYK